MYDLVDLCRANGTRSASAVGEHICRMQVSAVLLAIDAWRGAPPPLARKCAI